jgi:hypothetical protein
MQHRHIASVRTASERTKTVKAFPTRPAPPLSSSQTIQLPLRPRVSTPARRKLVLPLRELLTSDLIGPTNNFRSTKRAITSGGGTPFCGDESLFKGEMRGQKLTAGRDRDHVKKFDQQSIRRKSRLFKRCVSGGRRQPTLLLSLDNLFVVGVVLLEDAPYRGSSWRSNASNFGIILRTSLELSRRCGILLASSSLKPEYIASMKVPVFEPVFGDFHTV